MLNWLRRYLSTDQRALDALERRVAKLEHSELDREASLGDTLHKLERFYKRLRQRQVNDATPDSSADPITKAVLMRRTRGGPALKVEEDAE